MVFLRKSLLDTLMQIFIMLRHLVAEISRFKFDDYRVIRTGASDLKLFGRCISFCKDYHIQWDATPKVTNIKGTHSSYCHNVFNSSLLSAAYMRRRTGSALDQVIAWRLFRAKSLSKQCCVIVNWTLRNKLQWNFNRYKSFHSQKCIRKYHLRNGGHVVQGEMS